MARNLSHKIASIMTISKPTQTFLAESATQMVPNSVSSYLMSTSATNDQDSGEKKEIKTSTQFEEKKENVDIEDDEDDDDGGVNKETGEIGGPRGPEPTRYGDWEQKGRCSDF
ncbi:hypothetical protein SOVF_130190 [Spinacia oleracea]|nr:hypothetical protein SOVF_130190 [Spinacia oleracea]